MHWATGQAAEARPMEVRVRRRRVLNCMMGEVCEGWLLCGLLRKTDGAGGGGGLSWRPELGGFLYPQKTMGGGC